MADFFDAQMSSHSAGGGSSEQRPNILGRCAHQSEFEMIHDCQLEGQSLQRALKDLS